VSGPSGRPPQRGHWLRGRVLTLGLLGTLVALALMVWAGRSFAAELDRHERQSREFRARMVADRIDRVLTAELEKLEAVASFVAPRLHNARSLRPELHQLHRRSNRLFDQVFLLDLSGQLLLDEPSDSAPVEGKALVQRALERRRPVFTPVHQLPDGRARLYLVMPIRSAPGEIVGVLGAGMDPGTQALANLLITPNMAAQASVDLVDASGLVFASSDPQRRNSGGVRLEQVAEVIGSRRTWSGLCHDCHENEPGPLREEFSISPMAVAPWGVKVRQPLEVAHAFEASMATRTSLAGLALVVTMIFFAHGASRSLIRPLESLTASAERLARGELSEPIPDTPPDEIGRLGGALEHMRVALGDALARVAQVNEALEQRVEERTRELERVNEELKVREASRAQALRKVITAQEEERRRIARELHDETSQSLAALAMNLDTVARGQQDPAAKDRVLEASALARRTLEAVHGLCINLRPPVLDDLGLQSAIEWCADRILTARGVSVRCEFSGLDARLPPEVETALFRCAQEAMNNIARHAEAETVLVQCALQGRTLTLEVEDDGKGFDPRLVGPPDASGRGLGLMGLRERVDLLGGQVQISSAPLEGTRVALTIPVPEEVS
jgi:signal transduction histidine kinase